MLVGVKKNEVCSDFFIWGRQGIFSELGILLEDKVQGETVHSRRGIKVIKWVRSGSAHCPVTASSYDGDHAAGCVND